MGLGRNALAPSTVARGRWAFHRNPHCEPIRFLARDRCLLHSYGNEDGKDGYRHSDLMRMNPRPLLGRADGELQSRDQSDPPPTRWSHDSGQAAGPRRRGHRLSAANDALGTKQTRWGRLTMSAPEGKTDVPREPGHFRF